MAGKPKFTRIPKVQSLIQSGAPAEAIPTYCALADYANNKTGLCFPKMETLAETLNRSVRTIQRHLHLLRQLGLIEFVERRRHRGRFSSYLYKVVHIVRTTGHTKRVGGDRPIYKGTKRSMNTPYSPPREGYSWLFGRGEDPAVEAAHKREQNNRRSRESEERKKGYDWLFE